MSVTLPSGVAESMMREAEVRREKASVEAFARDLKSLDPRLDVFLMAEDIPEYDVRGGFYYIRRRNDDGTVSFWEIRNPDGSYREPDSAVLEAMKKIDANADDLTARMKRRHEIDRRKKEKRQSEKRRQFREGLEERLKFIDNGAGILIPASFKDAYEKAVK